MAEFTGERVIPELVDADLLNEHVSRYRFARRFAANLGEAARILDAGCGTGYGTAELADAASITGTDIAAEAVEHAHSRYGSERVRFVRSACETLPFGDSTFDLLVAFEVIEHLDRWQDLLSEAQRVLKSGGVLLVSTPNRDYYPKSRGEAGPNPFHRHEFDYAEFQEALAARFAHVRIWAQNHAEAIVFAPTDAAASGFAPTGAAASGFAPTGAAASGFAPEDPAASDAESPGSNDPASASFYLAACSQSPIAVNDAFVWVPTSANVLKERELHIAKLQGELKKKDAWLRQTVEALGELQTRHEELTAEMERQNVWAAELDREVALRNKRIAELQGELETRLNWVSDLEAQIGGAQTEIGRLNAESERLAGEAGAEIARLEATVTERTLWAQRLDRELGQIRASRWFRVGKKLGLGPHVRDIKVRDIQ